MLWYCSLPPPLSAGRRIFASTVKASFASGLCVRVGWWVRFEFVWEKKLEIGLIVVRIFGQFGPRSAIQNSSAAISNLLGKSKFRYAKHRFTLAIKQIA